MGNSAWRHFIKYSYKVYEINGSEVVSGHDTESRIAKLLMLGLIFLANFSEDNSKLIMKIAGLFGGRARVKQVSKIGGILQIDRTFAQFRDRWRMLPAFRCPLHQRNDSFCSSSIPV